MRESGYKDANKLSEALAQITKMPALSAGTLQDAAGVIADIGCNALNTHRIGVWSTADGVNKLKSITYYDVATRKHAVQDDLDISNCPEYICRLQSERLVIISDALKPNPLSPVLDGYGPNIRAMLDAPIRIGGKLAGVVCIEQDRCDEYPEKREWTIEEQNFASSLADFMALAIGSAEWRALMHGMLEAVNQAAVCLLTEESNEDIKIPIMAGMEFLGRALDVDRVHIWQLESKNDIVNFIHAYCWASETGKQKAPMPAGISFPFGDKPEWERRFMRGEYVGGIVSKMQRDYQEFFDNYGVKSTVIIPLFINERFWGLFSVDNCFRERDFTEDEITILRTISLMMASAINRRILSNEIKEAHESTKQRLGTLVEERTRELALQTTTLNTLFDSIPDLIFVKDLNLRYTQCNKSLLEHFARREEDIIGRGDTDASGIGFSDEEAREFNERDRKVIEERETDVIEELVPRADGVKMLFETIKMPLILDGDVVGILGIARDITKRKEAERVLAANYEYSKKLTDALAKITKSPNISAGNLKAAANMIAEIGCNALGTHRVGIWSTTDEAKTLKSITYYDVSTGEYDVQDERIYRAVRNM